MREGERGLLILVLVSFAIVSLSLYYLSHFKAKSGGWREARGMSKVRDIPVRRFFSLPFSLATRIASHAFSSHTAAPLCCRHPLPTRPPSPPRIPLAPLPSFTPLPPPVRLSHPLSCFRPCRHALARFTHSLPAAPELQPLPSWRWWTKAMTP